MTELLRYAYLFSDNGRHEQSLFDPIESIPGQAHLSKKPGDTERFGPVLNADRGLLMVAMLRDPRAVVTSFHKSHPDRYFVDFGRWQSNAAYINRYSSHPRCLLVRYEDLIRHPNRVQAVLGDRFPSLIHWRRRFSEYPNDASPSGADTQNALAGVRPFDLSRLSAWRKHPERLAAQISQHPDLAQQLIRYGYEDDDRWTAMIQGVELGAALCRSVKTRPRDNLETKVRYGLKTLRYRLAMMQS